MGCVGTLPWARQTGGRIGARDRAELIRLAALTGLIDFPRYLLYRGRKRSWSPSGSFDKVPGTVAATAALTRLSAVAPAYLVNHSRRTYWFSRLIGDAIGSTYDDELLYVASLAHDAGLYARSAPISTGERCFSIRGANWATDIALDAGWETERTDRLAEAITLNLNGRGGVRVGSRGAPDDARRATGCHRPLRMVCGPVPAARALPADSAVGPADEAPPRVPGRSEPPTGMQRPFRPALAGFWSSHETSTQGVDIVSWAAA